MASLYYLGMAIVGFILLAASLVAGDHPGGGHDVGHADSGAHEGQGTSVGTFALRIFSIRFVTYLLAFGGLAGFLLRRVAHTGEPAAALLAALVGALSALFASLVLARATRGGDAGTSRAEDFAGRTAGVLVPFGKSSTGKIRVHIKGSDVDLLARTDDGTPLDRDEQVTVIEVRDGSALVTRNLASVTSPDAPANVPSRGPRV